MVTIYISILLILIDFSSFSQTFKSSDGASHDIKYIDSSYTVKIRKILPYGESLIHKLKSGERLYAIVKGNKIVAFRWTDIKGKTINDNFNSKKSGIAKTAICLNCFRVCSPQMDEDGVDTGGSYCINECVRVDCDKEHNSIMWVDKAKTRTQ